MTNYESQHPRIAVVIPTLTAPNPELLASIAMQHCQPDDIIVVHGVSPNGKARNHGAAQTRADWLLFIDDDAVLGHADVIGQLYAASQRHHGAVVGSARLLPHDAPPFQRHVADQVARIEHPVVTQDHASPPVAPDFYTTITTTCCGMPRQLWQTLGGFDEQLRRGVDTEFFVRLHRLYPHVPIIQVAQTWVYHPAPATLSALWRKQFAYGSGHAQEVRRDPSRARGGNFFQTPLHAFVWISIRTLLMPLHAFVPYSFADRRWRIGWYPLKAFASWASALGYVSGWYRHEHI
jgi:GT2 family glycosyltransferase